jgi:hypothetical protein
MGRRGGARVFVAVIPTAEDLARARALPRSACPRRYCWWWQSLAFDWNTPVAAGCRLRESAKPPGFRSPDVACCRLEPASGVDQYEPREPHLEEDGFHRDHFLVPGADPAGET